LTKTYHLILIIIVSILLNSCFGSNIGGRSGILTSDRDIADMRLEYVLKAIEDKDRLAIKAAFSKQALVESESIDSKIDYVFNFFQGDVVSIEKGGLVTREANDYGHKVVTLLSKYTIKTTCDEYLFFLLDYIEVTDNPDNIGLYMLQIIKLVNRDTEFDWGSKTRCAGVYRP